MLQSADDCSALLTFILADGKPKRGLTLIALVDHATLRLHGIARMPIPHSDRTHPRRGLLHRGVGARVGHGLRELVWPIGPDAYWPSLDVRRPGTTW